MKFAKIKAIREWMLAWKALAANGWYVLACALLDIAFFVAYGFIRAPLFENLTNHVIVVGTLLTQKMSSVADRTRPAIIDALFQPPVLRYTLQFIGLLAVLALVIFVLYCIFQGVAWYLAGKLDKSKMHWRVFLTHFARINLLWFGFYFLWQCVSMVFDLRRVAIEKATSQPAPEAGIALMVVLAVLVYFAIISYPSLSIRKAFSMGTRRLYLLAAGFIVLLQFFVGNLVVTQIARFNPKLSFIVGVILMLVLISWSRAYATFVVRRK